MNFCLSILIGISVLSFLLLSFETKGWLSIHDQRRFMALQSIGMTKESGRFALINLAILIRRFNPEKKLRFLDLNPQQFFRIMALIVAIAAAILGIIARSIMLMPISAAFVTGMVLIGIDKVYQKRIKDFESFFEEGIQNLIASLQAGMNLVQAFEVVANSKTNMINKTFQRMLAEYNVGMSLHAAVKNTGDLTESKDMQFFAQTIDIYYSSGGDVTEILDSMLQMMRRRRHVEGDLEAKTSEVRMTANLLIVLPVLLFGYLCAFQVDMIEPLLHEPIGQAVLTAGLLLWGTGVFVVKKLTDIRTLS